MITRDEAILFTSGGEPDANVLQFALQEHRGNVDKRLNRLNAYYSGRHAILNRQKHLNESANNKIVANFARYIVTMASGYLIGAPVSYSDAKQADALSAVIDLYDAQNIDTVDAELARNASEYGRGVEYLYMDEDAKPRAVVIDPRSAFVIYSDTVDQRPLLGVYIAEHVDAMGRHDYTAITACTDAKLYTYKESGKGAALTPSESPQAHVFGAVPINEYWNNDDETSDFEGVVSQIDAYNLLQSDRVNDKEQLVDALLVLIGASLGDDTDQAMRILQIMREQRALDLPDGADAKFLTKQLSESDAQVLSDSLRNDIFALSMVPELTDQNFAGNASGVAMRYKLLGLEQLTKIKERWFREGLQARLAMYASAMAVLGKAALDTSTVQMTFTRSLPVNDLEQAQMVSTLQGVVPDEILLKQLSFIDDPEEAAQQMADEKAKKLEQEAKAFGYPTASTPEAEEKDDGERD